MVHPLLGVSGMSPSGGSAEVMVVGAFLGIAVRWILSLELDTQLAACIGAVFAALQPWVPLDVSSVMSLNVFPLLLVGGGVAAALVGIQQTFHH